ncbi:rho GTPase-activating protein 25 isoform X2 [Numida meleagris]|uniref:rho GTPase-activating protein 25 isoform X2 n=1 Tax=Numida meleagris TaxID=8996 RepID=UPI000B3E04AF|nr:rho GTPase-activating protein 25 isoform X2 [Numida meleagris]
MRVYTCSFLVWKKHRNHFSLQSMQRMHCRHCKIMVEDHRTLCHYPRARSSWDSHAVTMHGAPRRKSWDAGCCLPTFEIFFCCEFRRKKPLLRRKAVFGQRLAETMAYEQKFGQQQVPILVQKCAEFIREHGVSEEGIFRLPGQDNLVKQLRDAFDAGERPSFDRNTDVHTVASLLKLYLRELPEPVVPWMQYEDFLLCGQTLDVDQEKGHQDLLKQLSLLPRDNYNLLSYICRFLYEIQLNSSVNKMSVDNLATVIGVNLIRPKIEDPATIMRGTLQIQKVMTVMISDHADLFPPSKDVPPSPTTQQNDKKTPILRSSVGWDSAEDSTVARADSSVQRQMRDSPNASRAPGLTASSRAPSEDTGMQPSKDTLGMWKMQARKRTQTLPNRKSFLTTASPGEKGSSDRNDIFNSDFWKGSTQSNPRSVLSEGHKRTLSHDLFKLLDLHRASTYDNVPTSQVESREGSSSSPSPASSCSDKEFQPCLSPCHQPQEPASPAEMFQPAPESKESLQSMVLKLQREMEEQKETYEEQIKSLEKENYDVWAKVVRLNQDIEREKKKSEDLELKLKNMERLQEDLEKKNKMLEEEIETIAKSRSKSDAKTI